MGKYIFLVLAAFSLLFGVQSILAYTPSQLHAPRIKVKNGQSTNWSGYASLTNLNNPQPYSVSDAQGSWTVPALTCTNSSTYSSAWVGIDGYSDGTVEQTGTEHDCINGTPSYYAWYEMYPKMSRRLSMSVHAGDSMFAEVNYNGGNQFVLTLRDNTTGQSFTTTQRGKAQRTSAEWIVEAPWSGGVLPLANFGTLPFINAQATINGHTGPVNDPSWQNDPITMTDSSGNVIKAVPSSLSNGGYNFSVQWYNN